MTAIPEPPGTHEDVVAVLTRHHRALVSVADWCRSVAADALGVDLPAIRVEVEVAEPASARVHHDRDHGIRIAVPLVAFEAPPAGANLRYGVCHEMGHLTVLHARPDRRSPGVVWDEALAHLLATELFLPALPDDLAPEGSGDDWRAVEVAIGQSDTAPDITASLERCVAVLAARCDLRGLVADVARIPASELRADRFAEALHRARTC